MKINAKVEWAIGFFFGALTPLFGLAIFLQIYPVLETVTSWTDPSWQLILMRLATFGVMTNTLVFFLALRFGKDRIAMGVLWACILYLGFVGYMQIAG